jgi:hypothetical protein
MSYFHRMADLSMRDLERLHRAKARLLALANGIGATSQQGKPAMLQLLSEVEAEVDAIFRKGVIGLANHVRRGKVPTGYDDPDFTAHVHAVIQQEMARRQPQPDPGDVQTPDGAAAAGNAESGNQ